VTADAGALGGGARLHDRVLGLLAEHHVVSLATTSGADLWAASVFYAHDVLDLVFVSSPDSRHSRHIAASGRVAATVDAQQDDWREIRGLQLEGVAGRVAGAELARALDVYLARFPWISDLVVPTRSTLEADIVKIRVGGDLAEVGVYRFAPTRILLIDNRQGFGHREELVVDGSDPA